MRYGFHPVNLGVRFLLELAAVVALGILGASLADGVLSAVLALALPLIGMGIWGTFAVPGDRSRSGEAPIPVSGAVRLLVEGGIFTAAVAALVMVDRPLWAGMLALCVIVHYALSVDRINWLVRQ